MLVQTPRIQSEREIIDYFRRKTDFKFDSSKVELLRPSDFEDMVSLYVQTLIDEYDIDAKIENVVVTGSRCRGLEREDSDLDVVLSYSGSEREDDFFNLIHDEKIEYGGVEVDVNPINVAESGNLSFYLPNVERYLEEKKVQIEEKEQCDDLVLSYNCRNKAR